MRELTTEELMEVQGGANLFTGSFITALVKAGNFLLETGRSLGTAIRRIFDDNVCSY